MKRKNMSIVIGLTLVIAAFAIVPLNIGAATPEEIQQSIDDGIAWLITQQNPITGAWQDVPRTGFVLIKLQDRAYELGKDPFETDPGEPDYYEYAANVIHGWEYLFSVDGYGSPIYTWKQTIGNQDHTLGASGTIDNPDTRVNNYGISFQGTVYYTGICLMALAASGDPNHINEGSIDYDGDSNPETFGEIAQDVVDWFAWAQADVGTYEGGYSYGALDNQCYHADNSNSGYAYLGLAAAEGFGCTVPQWVKDELDVWIDWVQNDQGSTDDAGQPTPDGGSGYEMPTRWVNELKTGNLIFEMTFYGDVLSVQRFQYAIDYIERHWNDANLQPGFRGDAGIDDDGDTLIDEDPYEYPEVDNDGDGLVNEDMGLSNHYQAMYCLMKGLEYSNINLLDLDGDNTPEHNWFEELATMLLDDQNPDGSWPSSPCYVWSDGHPGTMSGGILSTVWALLTLEKVTPPPPMTIDKTLSVSEGELGDMITVTINVNNPNAYTVIVVDTLPKGFHFIEGTFTVDGAPATPTIDDHKIEYTFTETGPHVIEFDVKIDEAKSWEDMEVCNVATATWYEDETVIETKEDVECFIILPFEELHKNVGIPKADVVFAIDLSGSMWTELGVIQSQAATIINNIQSSVGDVQFGLMTFMDYVGDYTTTSTVPGAVPTTYTGTYGSVGWGDYPYNLNQDIGSAASVISAIGLLTGGSGEDWPQDYSRIVHESYNDPNLHWRTGATKFLILFGDAWPHDTGFDYDNDGAPNNAGGDPGRDKILGNADDLDFETEVANAAANGIRILSVYSGGDGSKYPWTYMASQTGGQYFKLTEAEQIPEAIKDLLKSEAQETLTVKVGEDVQWAIVIDVVNPFPYTMGDTVITDRFGAEIEIDDPFPYHITHGTVSYTTKGKSEKVFLTWEIGDLLPGETARLILLVSTDKNPKGHQEYTSPGIYELNSGATLKFIDTEQDTQLSAYTDSIYVTVLPEEDP